MIGSLLLKILQSSRKDGGDKASSFTLENARYTNSG